MTSVSVHIADNQCKFCRKPILNSIAGILGTDAVGYICPDCIVKEQQDMDKLGAELSALSKTVQIDAVGSPLGCAMCNDKTPTQYRLVAIDGRQGLICLSCEPKWMLTNREKLGRITQHKLKLR